MLVVGVGRNRDAVETAWPRLPFVWLATASAEDGVFAVKREDIVGGVRG
jgi:ribosomal protein L3 glutamine methyltransferase